MGLKWWTFYPLFIVFPFFSLHDVNETLWFETWKWPKPMRKTIFVVASSRVLIYCIVSCSVALKQVFLVHNLTRWIFQCWVCVNRVKSSGCRRKEVYLFVLFLQLDWLKFTTRFVAHVGSFAEIHKAGIQLFTLISNCCWKIFSWKVLIISTSMTDRLSCNSSTLSDSVLLFIIRSHLYDDREKTAIHYKAFGKIWFEEHKFSVSSFDSQASSRAIILKKLTNRCRQQICSNLALELFFTLKALLREISKGQTWEVSVSCRENKTSINR